MTCVCGQPATIPVIVHWADGDRTYRYCPVCALDVCVDPDAVTPLAPPAEGGDE